MNRNQTLPATCEQTVSVLTATLTSHGYRVERSFDLRSALHHHSDCPCPHHGTEECSCQYVVLLVYDGTHLRPPALVTAHECDGVTRLHAEASQPGWLLETKLMAALDDAMTAMS
ncbi:MAG TPA: hypothetical protein VIK33_15415 [Anaerolineae bacterium]